jgi:hypothetical protein
MNAYFCEKTGVRIAAPGVCKAVDPTSGQDEFSEGDAPAKSSREPKEPALPVTPAEAREEKPARKEAK